MRFFKCLIFVLLLSLTSCNSNTKSEESSRKVKCESAALSSDNLEVSLFTGKVVATTDLNLGFRVAGIIEEICFDDGAHVLEGEVIARLDSRDYALQVEATQAEYNAVKAEADRVIALYADKSVSANDYDKAVNGLRAITAKLEAHKNALHDTELRSPLDGFIHKSNFGRGEAVSAGTPVISIISDSAPEITIDIPTVNYLKHDRFESAVARADIFAGREFKLTLKGITPKANLNQLHKATFTVETEDGVLPPVGISTTVEMRYTKSNQGGVTTPFSAVFQNGGESYVWVVNGERVERRAVKISEIKSCGTVSIESGINGGEVVVTAGVNTLKEGDKVTPLEEVSSSNIGRIK